MDEQQPSTANPRHYSRLVVFHPSPNLVDVVDDLLKRGAPDIAYENIVEPELLDEAIRDGITDAVRGKIERVILGISPVPTPLVFCTCSTLGGVAEEIGRLNHRDVIRIDRPMAEEAVKTGPRIGVVAALASTIKPTRELLESVAEELGATIDIRIIHCKAAWAHKQRGDENEYIAEVTRCLESETADLDVVVLAQGSMAPAKARVSVDVPILTSPELGVQRVVRMMRAQ